MRTNHKPLLARGLVVSDLHLFAQRSAAPRHLEALKSDLSSMDLLVLNGDIFDFKWSTLADQATTLDSALDWLRTLTHDLPHCQVHFVLGNHDCTPEFKQGLTKLAAAQPRLHWHEFVLRLGSNLFLHGDCTHTRMNHQGLLRYRDAWQVNRQQGPLMTAAYAYVDRLTITKFVHRRQFPQPQTVKRVTHYLDDAQPGWRKHIRDCYFGHTHLPFKDHEHEGVKFHNTGSAIKHLDFNPVTFETTIEANGKRNGH